MKRRRAYAQIYVELPLRRPVRVSGIVSVHGGTVVAEEIPPRGKRAASIMAIIKIVLENTETLEKIVRGKRR